MSIEPFFSESEIIQSDDLIELTADINRRHALGERLGASWVENAIIIGLELLKIRNQVPIGSWCRWIDDNAEFSRVNAFRYIRVAEHQGQLRLASAKTELEAGEVITGMASGRRDLLSAKVTPEMRKRVLDGREAGLTWRAIAEELGVTGPTAHRWVDENYRRQCDRQRSENVKRARREKRAAKRLIAQEEKAQLLRQAPPNISIAYSEIRRALQHLDGALGEATDNQTKEALGLAASYARRAEYAIGDALGAQWRPH